MKVQVLGSGCPTCKKLHQTVQKIVSEVKPEAEVAYETDITKAVEFGIMQMPALVVDGKVITAGRVPTEKEIEEAVLSCGRKKDCLRFSDVLYSLCLNFKNDRS